MVRIVGVQPERSISQHVAKHLKTQILFGVLVGLASLIAAVAAFGWLLPNYDAGIIEYILFGILLTAFFLTALIPHIEGSWRGAVHNFVAWGIVGVIPLVMIAVLSWSLSVLAFWISLILLFVNCFMLFLALYKRDNYRKVFLYFQTAYVSVAYLQLTVLTYM